MSEKTIKIRYWIQTDKVGSRCEDEVEYLPEDLEGMTDDEISEEILRYIWDMAEWNWERVEGN